MALSIVRFTAKAFLFILILFSPLAAQILEWEKQLETDPMNKELLLKLGKAYHDSGGDKADNNTVMKADKYLSKLLELEPANTLALVYFGSLLTMKAREALLPWDKMKYMTKGFAKMDSAVAIDPYNPEVRLIRAINSASVPQMFNRLHLALSDFSHIEGLDKDKLKDLSPKFWLPFYYHFGLALVKDKQVELAKQKFDKVIELDQESNYGQKAKQQLEKGN